MKNESRKKHPLIYSNCEEYSFIEYEGVRFEDPEQKKGFEVKTLSQKVCKLKFQFVRFSLA
ncbi:hypothetical protein GCM10011339_42890 [Echinicola rosea]|uniref:Uncharacterized protein n=1 Tax=Echinicola rosea TaxID=1807691 RepID=A0ABQ1VBW5_9BACT|nr:hypothetical protein GCM10011339_42890 [Echinicola rosea]